MAGCGGDSEPSEDKNSEEKVNTESNDTQKKEEEEKGSGETAKITFWDMMWGEAGVYDVAAEALVDQYNQENPNVKVEYQSVPWDNYYQTF